jgi:hypothetical protein
MADRKEVSKPEPFDEWLKSFRERLDVAEESIKDHPKGENLVLQQCADHIAFRMLGLVAHGADPKYLNRLSDQLNDYRALLIEILCGERGIPDVSEDGS